MAVIKIRYKNNTIDVRAADGKQHLYINGKMIDVEEFEDEPNPYRSEYAYLPAATLEELGHTIIEQQEGLETATLPGFETT